MPSADLARANRFDCVAYEVVKHADEALHVRELEVRVDRGIVLPNGMNEQRPGSAFFFVQMNLDTAGLSASRLQDAGHLSA